MKYKATPFNAVSIGLIILSLWAAAKPGPMGWGFLLLFYLLPVGLVGLLIDFFIQLQLTNNYKQLFVIEASVLIFIAVTIYCDLH